MCAPNITTVQPGRNVILDCGLSYLGPGDTIGAQPGLYYNLPSKQYSRLLAP